MPGTVRLTDDGFVVRARAAGTARVRVRHSRWFRVLDGPAGCLGETADGFVRLRVAAPGTIRVQARLTGERCG